jgi:hypothetical protein
MILVLIQILITVVIGAILFWLIDKFIRDGRLAICSRSWWYWCVWRRFCSGCCRCSGSASRVAPTRGLQRGKGVIL